VRCWWREEGTADWEDEEGREGGTTDYADDADGRKELLFGVHLSIVQFPVYVANNRK
jgi:hypothetical protein